MLKIRLARIGRKNDPSFRVVAIESTRGPKTGKYVEVLGSYNPKLDSVAINGERVLHWIANGAQVSPTVHNILVGQGILTGKKVNVLPKKSPIMKEVEEGAAPAEAAVPSEEAAPEETTAPAEVAPEESAPADSPAEAVEAPAEPVSEEAAPEEKSE